MLLTQALVIQATKQESVAELIVWLWQARIGNFSWMQPTYSTAHPRNECFFQMRRCFESFNSRREITLLHQAWLLAAPTRYYSSYYTLCMRFCHVPQIHCTHTTYFNVAAVTETALSYSTPQSLLSVYGFLTCRFIQYTLSILGDVWRGRLWNIFWVTTWEKSKKGWWCVPQTLSGG